MLHCFIVEPKKAMENMLTVRVYAEVIASLNIFFHNNNHKSMQQDNNLKILALKCTTFL